MLRYWTVWNFAWWSYTELARKKYNGPLCLSIITTSLVGGLITFNHVHQRKWRCSRIVGTGDVVYKPGLFLGVLEDVIFHQVPMMRMYHQVLTDPVCGPCAYWLVGPYAVYGLLNAARGKRTKQIYGIDETTVAGLALGVAVLSTPLFHRITIRR